MCATGFVCSKHFKKEDFAWNAGALRKRLKRGIVPSRFPWSVDGGSTTSEKKHPAEIKILAKGPFSPQRAPMVDESLRYMYYRLAVHVQVVPKYVYYFWL